MTLQERINEAREAVRGPGKFEGESPMVPLLWDIVLDGGADAECSCDTEPLARIGRWTLYESVNGFVYGLRHTSVAEAQAVLDECVLENGGSGRMTEYTPGWPPRYSWGRYDSHR